MQDVQSYTTPTKRPMRFEPSQRFSERKRALFPSQDSDSDGDLGHMSPLELSSSSERFENFLCHLQKSPGLEDKYFTLLDSDDEETTCRKEEDVFDTNNFENNENIPPPDFFASNTPTPTDSPQKDLDTTCVPETPVKESPTQVLKTPHDTLNNTNNIEVPRLLRKSLLDTSNIDKSNLKRKSDLALHSVESKNIKLDNSFNKVSKVRTALFTENIFPVKTFYPKNDTFKQEVNIRSEMPSKKKPFSHKARGIYLCSRLKGRNRKYSGQINAGVRHGIRKPKYKSKLTKTQLLKAALQILKNSPLNQYLNERKQEEIKPKNEYDVSDQQLQKMDSILKNIDTNHMNAKPLTVLSKTEPVSQNISDSRKQIDEKKQFPSVKRPLSPQPEIKKKFFKSTPSLATVTINTNIKLKIDNGEISLIEKEQKSKNHKFDDIEFDVTDLTTPEDNIVDNSFTDILKTLEDDKMNEEDIVRNPFALEVKSDLNDSTNLTLTAHTLVSASENAILLHNEPTSNSVNQNSITSVASQTLHLVENPFQNFQRTDIVPVSNIHKPNDLKPVTSDMLLSPTSLVCDMTSVLALDSPKSQTAQTTVDLNKLNASKKRISFTENMSDEQKLYPIFCGKQTKQNTQKNPVKESRHVKNIRKIWKPLSDDQTLIDAGQKQFGVTQCPECKVIYSIGEPEDEIMHYKYHNNIGILRYNGWKHERVVNLSHNGKVIQVNPTDPKSWWRKVKDLLIIINEELGFVDVPFDTTNKKVFLYIANRQIVGCLVAEAKQQAYKMLPADGIDQCSEESYPIKCGISRLWVAVTHRKQGIATCLTNVMRAQFIYGHILSMSEIAFSSPTETGKLFAKKYTKTDSFLIYTC